MSLLEITGLSLTYGEKTLYENAELTLNKGEHMGVVGRNGVGKSTLIKICTGQAVPDRGQVRWQPGVTFGYLDQYAGLEPEWTTEAFLKSAFADLYETEKMMMGLYGRAAEGEPDLLRQAAECQNELERRGFYEIDTRIRQVAEGLGLNAIGLDRAVGEMSGGQRAKVILAKLLLEQPDILLLDEPTNFLDKEHVAWLGEYLSKLERAFLVVSHDFDFLDKVSNRVCDIEGKNIMKYYGSYTEYLKKKELLRENYVRQYTAQQRQIRKTEDFIRRNKAGIKSKMARGRQKQLDRLDRLETPAEREFKPFFSFREHSVSSTDPLVVRNLAVGYDYPVLKDISFSVGPGQKLVLTGFNGIGKSTLLKTLMGELPVLKGHFGFSGQVVPGYFKQELSWPYPGASPLQIVSDTFPSLVSKEVRRQLARCGISDKHAAQPVSTLSGGEQARVKLCLLTLRPCNFLLLDEPTNHLDRQAKEALGEALSGFSGAVLLVSHEEAFYRGWVRRVIQIGQE